MPLWYMYTFLYYINGDVKNGFRVDSFTEMSFLGTLI